MSEKDKDIHLLVNRIGDLIGTMKKKPQKDKGFSSQFANPGPIGLCAFALTTFVLSVINTGSFSAVDGRLFISLGYFYGGMVQVIAGVLEFIVANTFGAVAFCTYGAFWISLSYIDSGENALIPYKISAVSLSVFLLAFTIFTVFMTIASIKVSKSIFVVFCILSVTFILLTISRMSGNVAVGRVAGWMGLACAASAWYSGLAVVINSTFKRNLFPLGAGGFELGILNKWSKDEASVPVKVEEMDVAF